jgi:hypothetical protein
MSARETVVHQSVQVDVSYSKHMAATATVAAVGAAELFVLFMPERDAAVPAIARGNVNVGFVNKFHGLLSLLMGTGRIT